MGGAHVNTETSLVHKDSSEVSALLERWNELEGLAQAQSIGVDSIEMLVKSMYVTAQHEAAIAHDDESVEMYTPLQHDSSHIFLRFRLYIVQHRVFALCRKKCLKSMTHITEQFDVRSVFHWSNAR